MYEELVQEGIKIVNNFNELCTDVEIIDIKFGDIDLENRVVQVIPRYRKVTTSWN